VYKNPWDYVKAWEKIASLDGQYLDININKAELALKTAKLNYEIKKRWATDTEINISQKVLDKDLVSMDLSLSDIESNISSLQNDLILAKKNLENTKKESEINLLTAKSNLDIAKNDYDLSLKDVVIISKQEEEKYINTANKLVMETWQIISNIEKYLYDIDVLLWISDANKDLNDSYETYLWTKNISIKISTENSYRDTKTSFDKFHTDWKIYKSNTDFSKFDSYEDLSKYTMKLRDISSNLNKTLNYTTDVLKNSISTYSFTQSIIDSNLSTFENALNTSKNDIANYVVLLQNMQEAKTNMQSKIDTVNKAVLTYFWKLELAKTNYTKTEVQNELDIDNTQSKIDSIEFNIDYQEWKKSSALALSKSQVNISKANLDNKKNLDSLDIEPYYMAIMQAQKALDEAILKKKDSILVSPIDGKIAQINGKKWESTNSLKEQFTVIISDKSFYTDAFVEEWDIVKVKKDQEVYIDFDSIDNLTLTWKVVYIEDKANIDTNWLVSYKVEILFENTDSRIKESMTTVVQFITKEVKNVLYIPVSAVKNISWKPSVIMENKEAKKIITWFTDSKIVEVISWLEKWEKVVY
jgi:multidrug efflux pump subunit AcrA (membrane-fusion protein)